MKRALLSIVPLFLLATGMQAQRPSAYGTVPYVDFSYGLPFYHGDLYSITGETKRYRGLPLNNPVQYNNNALQASALFPLSNRLYLKPQFSTTTVYYQEVLRRAFFRNALYDASIAAQFFVVKQRFGLYLFAGAGASISYKTELFNTITLAEQTPLSDRTIRPSANGGLGLHFNIWRRIHVFTEGQWTFTGSDRIDGYNGEIRTPNGFIDAPSEKSWLKRDQIITLRGGVRVPISRGPNRIEERPHTMPLSTINPDPNFDEVGDKDSYGAPVVKEKRDKPPLYYKLGVRKKLRLYTVAVAHTVTLEDLERFDASAKRVAAKFASKNFTPEVQLLEEPTGYTVHFGAFNTEKEARQFSKRLFKHYRNTEIRFHGK